jgi:prepilin-type N-terminal cleavage/methylation domain-containing protein
MLKKVRSFTLVELIIVVIIVGILASLGLTQYANVVEKSRLAEAKVRIGTMRQLAYTYYLENGDISALQYADVGVDNTCTSTDYYRYYRNLYPAYLTLVAARCTSGGKSPNASREYRVYLEYYPDTGAQAWHCYYIDNGAACFGMSS